jgi:hypothetical protein
MAQPLWITPAGSLGTIAEGQYYSVPLTATDPDGGPVYYKVIAGALPSGIVVDATSGLLHGIPAATEFVQAELIDLAETVTSKFAIRAYTTKQQAGQTVIDRLSDRTFTLSVIGQDNPEWITPAGSVGTYYDGTPVYIQLEYDDNDRFDPLQVRLVAGELPPGLSVDNNGLITGYNELVTPFGAGVIPGNDRAGQGWDDFPYDWPTSSGISKNYEFTLEVTDGKASDLRTFTIYVYARNSLTADNDVVSVNSTFVTADVDNNRRPIILTPAGSIGTVRHDNFFAYKIEAVDPNGNPFTYQLTTSGALGYDEPGTLYDEFGFDRIALQLPPNLALDPVTGWITGYLANIGATKRIYTFAITAVENPPFTARSDNVFYTMTLEGDFDTEVTWITPSDLGTINNGEISTISVQAVTRSGASLSYRLASPSRQGFLSSVWVNQGGSGYSSITPPSVTFISEFGYGATAFAEVVGGQVVAIHIDNPGFGYVRPPEVRISGGGGEGAQAISFLEYNPEGGLFSKLPQGLNLLPSGNLAGSVSWKTFLLDGGTTTIDRTSQTGRPPSFTTIDSSFVFHVEAYNASKTISSVREFRILVLNTLDKPVLDIDLVAFPPDRDRDFITGLLESPNVMQESLLYRPDDPNFGVSQRVQFLHLSGLSPQQTNVFVEAMTKNHYRKNLVLGEIKTARALDDDGNVLYEVVYSTIIDDLVNNQGISVGESVQLPYPADGQTVVYPNSLADMRERILQSVGKISERLPRWMVSRQENGQVLGYQPAWVIAYAKPGASAQLAYNIRNYVGNQLNTIDFELDRYELIRIYTLSWDFETQTWLPSAQTYFDNYTTTFDGNGTVFIAPTDTYATSDRENKYLVFPKTNILG